MKKIIYFFILFFLPIYAFGFNKPVNIGIVIDDLNNKTAPVLQDLKQELKSLLSDKIKIEDKNILSSDWNFEKSFKNYKSLRNNENIDLIISVGVLSSGAAAKDNRFKKPLIAVGIIDPEVQGLLPPSHNTSGINNFTYILFNNSLKKDLKRFYDVFPYRKVGIVADENIVKAVVNNNNPILSMLQAMDAEFGIIPITDNIDKMIDKLKGYDAIYLGYFGQFEENFKKILIDKLAEKKIPAFGASLEDIEYGALAAVSPKESMTKIIRRIALNTESFVQGKNLSTLPVNLKFEEKLTINMDAARKVGFSPKFSVLSQAEVVNNFDDVSAEKIGIKEVLSTSIQNNIDLRLSDSDVDIAKKDFSLTKSKYYPSVSINGSEIIIDEDRAKASFGQNAQRTAKGSLKAEQLIYSEELVSGIYVKRKLFEAQESARNAAYLDLINNTAKAYFDVLRAKTLQKIRKENLDLTKKHLSISKQREAVGYSGKSDIYRWESSLASATTSLFEASNNYRLSKMKLNKILNRSVNSPLNLKDESIDGELFKEYISARSYGYIDNPMGFRKFCDFLVKEAQNRSPELKELGLYVKAYERELKRYKRERFLPVASIAGEASHVFDRSGEGSDVSGVDPEDDEYTVSLNLSWPIFTGGSKSINIEKTEIQLEKYQDQILNTSQTIELNTRSALLNTVNKVVNLESSEKSAEFAKKSLVLIQDSYARGKMSLTDLINAQNESLNADLTYMNSVYEFLSAIFDLERAIGQFTILSNPYEINDFYSRMDAFMTNN